MAFSVTEFKSNLKQGGARPSLFKVDLLYPSGVTNPPTRSEFLVRASSLPASNIGTHEVFFHGKSIKIAGDRTIGEWPITCYNDTNFKLRNAFERWQNGINNMTDNEGLSNPVDYQVDAFVDQLDRNGNTLKSYTLRGAFPVEVGAIDLNYGTNDEVETFGVTFQYQYFETNTTT